MALYSLSCDFQLTALLQEASRRKKGAMQALLLLKFLSLKESPRLFRSYSIVDIPPSQQTQGKQANAVVPGKGIPGHDSPCCLLNRESQLGRCPDFLQSSLLALIFFFPPRSPTPFIQRQERVPSVSLYMGTILAILSKDGHFQLPSNMRWSQTQREATPLAFRAPPVLPGGAI